MNLQVETDNGVTVEIIEEENGNYTIILADKTDRGFEFKNVTKRSLAYIITSGAQDAIIKGVMSI